MASDQVEFRRPRAPGQDRCSRILVLLVIASILAAFNLIPTSAWQGALERVGWADAEPLQPETLDPPVAEAAGKPIPLAIGDRLPDLAFWTMEGGEARLTEQTRRVPLVIEFGSFT